MEISEHDNLSSPVQLPIRGATYTRLSSFERSSLEGISSATASATLYRMGIRNVFLQGPGPMQTGTTIVGSALTLQFMPQRDDVASGVGQEYVESRSALWAVFDAAQNGDVLVVAAGGDPYTGCVGEMLVSTLKNQGGVGAVLDGHIRDWPRVREIGLPLWSTGTTPNYASQASQFPWAYDVAVNCGGALVLPGDAIIADDDGAVVVPRQLVEGFVNKCHEVGEWESFARMRIDQGGSLSKYYPLSEDARAEYDQWRTGS